MKFKLIVFGLVLSIFSFAQTANQSKPDSTNAQAPAAAQSQAKGECPCCKAMADSKDAKCCHHNASAKAGEEAKSCCEGKDGMACMKDSKNSSVEAASCCKGADQKGCCAKSDKAPAETAMACCASGGHCGMQHSDHADVNK